MHEQKKRKGQCKLWVLYYGVPMDPPSIPKQTQHTQTNTEYRTSTSFLPINALTITDRPFIALKNIKGSFCRHSCWVESIMLSVGMKFSRNFGVFPMTSGRQRSTGFWMMCRNRNQHWAIQSSVIPIGINCASSSAETEVIPFRIRNQHWAIQSSVIPIGINCASSSAEIEVIPFRNRNQNWAIQSSDIPIGINSCLILSWNRSDTI